MWIIFTSFELIHHDNWRWRSKWSSHWYEQWSLYVKQWQIQLHWVIIKLENVQALFISCWWQLCRLLVRNIFTYNSILEVKTRKIIPKSDQWIIHETWFLSWLYPTRNEVKLNIESHSLEHFSKDSSVWIFLRIKKNSGFVRLFLLRYLDLQLQFKTPDFFAGGDDEGGMKVQYESARTNWKLQLTCWQRLMVKKDTDKIEEFSVLQMWGTHKGRN